MSDTLPDTLPDPLDDPACAGMTAVMGGCPAGWGRADVPLGPRSAASVSRVRDPPPIPRSEGGADRRLS